MAGTKRKRTPSQKAKDASTVASATQRTHGRAAPAGSHRQSQVGVDPPDPPATEAPKEVDAGDDDIHGSAGRENSEEGAKRALLLFQEGGKALGDYCDPGVSKRQAGYYYVITGGEGEVRQVMGTKKNYGTILPPGKGARWCRRPEESKRNIEAVQAAPQVGKACDYVPRSTETQTQAITRGRLASMIAVHGAANGARTPCANSRRISHLAYATKVEAGCCHERQRGTGHATLSSRQLSRLNDTCNLAIGADKVGKCTHCHAADSDQLFRMVRVTAMLFFVLFDCTAQTNFVCHAPVCQRFSKENALCAVLKKRLCLQGDDKSYPLVERDYTHSNFKGGNSNSGVVRDDLWVVSQAFRSCARSMILTEIYVGVVHVLVDIEDGKAGTGGLWEGREGRASASRYRHRLRGESERTGWAVALRQWQAQNAGCVGQGLCEDFQHDLSTLAPPPLHTHVSPSQASSSSRPTALVTEQSTAQPGVRGGQLSHTGTPGNNSEARSH
jgi:hypothetical protein